MVSIGKLQSGYRRPASSLAIEKPAPKKPRVQSAGHAIWRAARSSQRGRLHQSSLALQKQAFEQGVKRRTLTLSDARKVLNKINGITKVMDSMLPFKNSTEAIDGLRRLKRH